MPRERTRVNYLPGLLCKLSARSVPGVRRARKRAHDSPKKNRSHGVASSQSQTYPASYARGHPALFWWSGVFVPTSHNVRPSRARPGKAPNFEQSQCGCPVLRRAQRGVGRETPTCGCLHPFRLLFGENHSFRIPTFPWCHPERGAQRRVEGSLSLRRNSHGVPSFVRFTANHDTRSFPRSGKGTPYGTTQSGCVF